MTVQSYPFGFKKNHKLRGFCSQIICQKLCKTLDFWSKTSKKVNKKSEICLKVQKKVISPKKVKNLFFLLFRSLVITNYIVELWINIYPNIFSFQLQKGSILGWVQNFHFYKIAQGKIFLGLEIPLDQTKLGFGWQRPEIPSLIQWKLYANYWTVPECL